MRRRKSKRLAKRPDSKLWFAIIAGVLVIGLNPWWLLPIPAIIGILSYRKYARWKRAHQERHRVLLSGINEVDRMSGIQFEERLALHFRALGWKVHLTKKSGDNGADLVVTDQRGIKWAIQAKCYAKSVGVHAVYEVLGGKAAYGAARALVITNRTLTRAARELAKKAGVEVWERERLIEEFSVVAARWQRES